MPDPSTAVFLSYARQDAAAPEKIARALRDAGIEVWFDQSELRGGDAWDAAIRRQITTCALLIPIISANTQSRAEGYFRLEWKLAVDRSHLMSHDRAFLVPVVIDDTGEGDERVPDRFRELQWSRLPGGDTSTDFVERVQRLLQPEATASRPARQPATARPITREAAAPTPASRRTTRWLAAAVRGVVLIGAGLWVARSLSRSPPVVAYSAEDRRMSFALPPLQAAPDDAHAVQVARATGEALQTVIEMRKELIALAARATTEQAAAHEDNPRRLAKALNVHFLLLGSVARDGGGYAVTLVSIDGDSERTLNTQVLKVAPDAVKPRYRDDLLDAVYELMLPALGIEVRRARARPDSELDARDLSFRAWIDWSANRDANGKAANEAANALLTRALTLAPDDVYALRT
jgi:TolB-like protein